MSYSKQQVDENTDYKAGKAISLEDRMISVNFDNTLCLNSEGKLSCVSAGSGSSGIEYSEGPGIHINNHKISANVDGISVKVNQAGEIEAIDKSIKFKAGDGILITRGNNAITADIDGTSIVFNESKQLSVANAGKVYRPGDGLNVNGDTLNVQVDQSTIKINNDNQLALTIPSINYKAGDGITIDKDVIKTKIDNLTIQANPDGEIHAVVPTAGSALSSNSNKFDVNVDGTTIKVNENNQLEAVNSGSKEYKAGWGIEINDDTIKTRIDDNTMGYLDGKLYAMPYNGGKGVSVSRIDSTNYVNVNTDDKTIRVNEDNKLEAIGGSSKYTAGDGISINDNTIAINQNWFDIRDTNNKDGTFQLRNIGDASHPDIRLCAVEIRPLNKNLTRDFFTQTLGLNPDYEMDFNTSISQMDISPEITEQLGLDSVVRQNYASGESKYLLTIDDIPKLNITQDETAFLQIHLPDYVKDSNGKPIDSVICNVKKGFNGYISDINRVTLSGESIDVPDDLVTYNEVGCDIEFHKIAQLCDPTILTTEGMQIRICDSVFKILLTATSSGDGKFTMIADETLDSGFDGPNQAFHFNYEHQKELFKDSVVIQLYNNVSEYVEETITLNNFEMSSGLPSYTIPHVYKIMIAGKLRI